MRVFRPVFFVCGVLGLTMASLMFVVASYSWWLDDGEALIFAKSGMTVTAISLVLAIPGVFKDFAPTTRQLYLITTLSWVSLSLFASLPFVWSDFGIGLTDAVFEAVSGITTTGSTVLVGLRYYPPSILLWRSLLQWLGGLGVIGMAIAILPFLRVGGMRLFQAESSDWSEKSLPRFQSIAKTLWLVYTLLTLSAVFAYHAVGMSWFDSLNHAMTTVSTGGFSTDDASMGQFGVGALWVSTLFMFLGGLPFTLYIRLLTQKRISSLKDQQAISYLLIVLGLVLLLTTQQWIQGTESLFAALTSSTFHIVSVLTTTGYAAADYTTWGTFSIAFFFFVMFIGGCSGSTSGGLKIFRFELSWLFLKEQVFRLVHPNAIVALKYNGKPVSDDVMSSAIAFSFLFFLTLAFATMALSLTGLDVVTSLTGAATALTNVGPGLGDVIGPAGNFSTLHDVAKLILCATMILGRLELLTVIVVFTPIFWRG